MSNFFSLVILLAVFLGTATGIFLMIRGLVNVLFNRNYDKAYGFGCVTRDGDVCGDATHYSSCDGDYSVDFGGGDDGYGGDCGG